MIVKLEKSDLDRCSVNFIPVCSEACWSPFSEDLGQYNALPQIAIESFSGGLVPVRDTVSGI